MTAKKYKHWIIVYNPANDQHAIPGADAGICEDGVFVRKYQAIDELDYWQSSGDTSAEAYSIVELEMTRAEGKALRELSFGDGYY